MSGSTRIVVIPLKKLIIMICIIAALIILAAIFIFGGSSSDAAKSTGVNISTSTDTVKKNTSCPTYSPGVYTSSILLNGTPIDIQVTVDSDNINNIEMINLSESVQTMYPMLNSSFDEIKTAVMEAKSGFAPESLEQAAEEAKKCANVRVRGLMCIPPVAEGEHGSLPYFEKVHALFVDINAKLYDNTLDILSMGMSGDYEDAVRAGATMVRVGTAIFGARNYTI